MRGSPPRMRGKAWPNSAHNVASGITPAYAGKSHSILEFVHVFRDHPRVCGEKFAPRLMSRFLLGSPPRMRGKANDSNHVRLGHGITPAYAGKSSDLLPSLPGLPGSPPRMRGKGADLSSATAATRITPAYAGKRRSVFGLS